MLPAQPCRPQRVTDTRRSGALRKAAAAPPLAAAAVLTGHPAAGGGQPGSSTTHGPGPRRPPLPPPHLLTAAPANREMGLASFLLKTVVGELQWQGTLRSSRETALAAEAAREGWRHPPRPALPAALQGTILLSPPAPPRGPAAPCPSARAEPAAAPRQPPPDRAPARRSRTARSKPPAPSCAVATSWRLLAARVPPHRPPRPAEPPGFVSLPSASVLCSSLPSLPSP